LPVYAGNILFILAGAKRLNLCTKWNVRKKRTPPDVIVLIILAQGKATVAIA
jgi:hypothetical protein